MCRGTRSAQKHNSSSAPAGQVDVEGQCHQGGAAKDYDRVRKHESRHRAATIADTPRCSRYSTKPITDSYFREVSKAIQAVVSIHCGCSCSRTGVEVSLCRRWRGKEARSRERQSKRESESERPRAT
jgi:hypothetical protein